MLICLHIAVQRIHWLRARAQWYRWKEETQLVQYEMQWTVRYFLHESQTWKDQSINPNVSDGAKAYAARQSNIWYGRAAAADIYFKFTNKSYVKLVT
jgi:hypothetical protein